MFSNVVSIFVVFLFCAVSSSRVSQEVSKRDDSWMDVKGCGQGLTCGPDCQLLCLKMHNYYRSLHNAPPMKCDPELAKSAQSWTDEQARAENMHHSEWTDKFTESISWKGWGWEGMEKMEGAVPGATRSWYSEIKNDYNYDTGKGNGQAVGHFMAVVWKGETKLGCGLNIKPDDGTYVTAHYGPASHANVEYFELAPKNVLPRKDPEPSCDIRSTERKDCSDKFKAPFVTPEECLKAGCCYDDMFMSESSINFYAAEGRTWCFIPQRGARPKPPSTKAPPGGATSTSPPEEPTRVPGPTPAPETTPTPGETTTGPGPSPAPGKTTPPPAKTPREYEGNSCYLFKVSGSTWKGGREICSGYNKGDLVTIETEDEFKYIKSMISLVANTFGNKWFIGLEKKGDSWEWVNNKPLSIKHWSQGLPGDKGNYAMMSAGGEFFADDSTKTYGIICEYEPDGKCTPASGVTS